MSGLPKQVEENANLAEELHGRMYADPQAEAPKEEEQEEPVEETPEEEEEKPKGDEEEETYRKRFESLQGKYNAEVPRLHGELKQLKEMVFQRLGDVTKPAEPKPEAKANPYQEKIDKYREEYGDDLLEMARTLARIEVEERLGDKLKPVQEQVASVEETQIKAAQSNFMGHLDTNVKGDWKTLIYGNNEASAQFLSSPDPSGLYTMAELIDAYSENWDAEKLVKLLNYHFEATAPKVEKEPEVPVQRKPNPAKEALVAPSRQTPHNTPEVNDKRIWTRETMAEFQRLDRQNKYSPEESQALWADLLAAAGENRIRG